jgi:hypothetical protein
VTFDDGAGPAVVHEEEESAMAVGVDVAESTSVISQDIEAATEVIPTKMEVAPSPAADNDIATKGSDTCPIVDAVTADSDDTEMAVTELTESPSPGLLDIANEAPATATATATEDGVDEGGPTQDERGASTPQVSHAGGEAPATAPTDEEMVEPIERPATEPAVAALPVPQKSEVAADALPAPFPTATTPSTHTVQPTVTTSSRGRVMKPPRWLEDQDTSSTPKLKERRVASQTPALPTPTPDPTTPLALVPDSLPTHEATPSPASLAPPRYPAASPLTAEESSAYFDGGGGGRVGAGAQMLHDSPGDAVVPDTAMAAAAAVTEDDDGRGSVWIGVKEHQAIDAADRFRIYGTEQPLDRTRLLTLGEVEVSLVQTAAGDCTGAVASIRWAGFEVCRGVGYVVRDQHWGTTQTSEAASPELIENASGWTLKTKTNVADGLLMLASTISCHRNESGDVMVECTTNATPNGADFLTARTGYSFLHPATLAGHPFEVSQVDGRQFTARFPRNIAANQIMSNIKKLRHTVTDGRTLTVDLEGDTPWEMEDQRQWTDQSFKTYTRPLSLPVPYTLKGTVRVFRQEFTLEDAIGSHARSLEANIRVTNGIPLGCPLFLPVDIVNCVQTLKAPLPINNECA